MLHLDPTLKHLIDQHPDAFAWMMSCTGQTFRELEGRSTQKIELDAKNYFLKKHTGVGWGEIFKNLLQLRLPVINARNEWEALKKLPTLQIHGPKLFGYGLKGKNPAQQISFVLMEALPEHISLDNFFQHRSGKKVKFQIKFKILKEVARITRVIHEHGMNHRDLYICHFLLDKTCYDQNVIKIYLIDWHRAHIRKSTPLRWIIKDLASLYYSSADIGLTKRDCLRFMCMYENKNLKKSLRNKLWHKVKKRGDRLISKHSRE